MQNQTSLMTHIFLFLWKLLFGDELTFVFLRSGAALALGLLFLFAPDSAARLLPWVLWLVLGLIALAFFCGGCQSRKHAKSYWGLFVCVCAAIVFLATLLSTAQLARSGMALWAFSSALGLWMNALKSYNSTKEQVLRFSEGAMAAVIGLLLLLKFQRPAEDYRYLYMLFLLSIGMLNLGSAQWNARTTKKSLPR